MVCGKVHKHLQGGVPVVQICLTLELSARSYALVAHSAETFSAFCFLQAYKQYR